MIGNVRNLELNIMGSTFLISDLALSDNSRKYYFLFLKNTVVQLSSSGFSLWIIIFEIILSSNSSQIKIRITVSSLVLNQSFAFPYLIGICLLNIQYLLIQNIHIYILFKNLLIQIFSKFSQEQISEAVSRGRYGKMGMNKIIQLEIEKQKNKIGVRVMITVKSLATKKSSAFTNPALHISKMVDSQLQCNIGQFSSSHYDRASPTKKSKYRLPENVKGGIAKFQDKTIENTRSNIDQKRMYLEVQIKNVNESEQKLIKALQMILLKQKIDHHSLRILKNQYLQVNKCLAKEGEQNKRSDEKIRIPIQKMFSLYLDFYHQQVRQAVLKGKGTNSIIRPFLMLFSKMKQDSKQIHLKCYEENKNGHIIQSWQVKKLFHLYQPKAELRIELAKNEKSNKSLYLQMYQRYEKVPFYDEEQEIQLNPQQYQGQQGRDYEISEENGQQVQVRMSQSDLTMKTIDENKIEKGKQNSNERSNIQNEEIPKGKKQEQNTNQSLKKKLRILSSDALFLKSILN